MRSTLVDDLRGGHRRHFQRKRLQRLAVARDHRAHRAQRAAEATVGQPVVQLRHLHRRDIDRAQQHRGHLRRRLRSRPKRCRVCATLGRPTSIPTPTVARFSDSASARTIGTGPFDLLLEVLRLPVLAILELHVHRLVLHHGGGVVAAGFERRQVDEGLHERAHGAARIQRAVEAVVADIAAADDGDHVPALGRGDDDRAFERRVRVLLLLDPGAPAPAPARAQPRPARAARGWCRSAAPPR